MYTGLNIRGDFSPHLVATSPAQKMVVQDGLHSREGGVNNIYLQKAEYVATERLKQIQDVG